MKMKRDLFFVLLAALWLGTLPGCPDDSATSIIEDAAPKPDSSSTIDGTVQRSDAAVSADGEVQRVDEFRCNSGAVKTTTAVAKITGSNATIAIKPSAQPCLFDLALRQGSTEEVISKNPGGYLLAAGQLKAGVIVVCASNIDHGPIAGAGDMRQIRGVRLECAARKDGSWTTLTTLADGGDRWAAWISEVKFSDSDSSRFTVTYRRDFSLQFFNLADKGRPSTDGLYSVEVRIEGDKLIEVETSKEADVTWDRATNVTQTGGDITAAQRQRFAPYLDPTPDNCPPPAGCPLP